MHKDMKKFTGEHPDGGVPHGKRYTIAQFGPNADHVQTADPRIEVQSVPSKPFSVGAKPLDLKSGERGTSR